MAFFRDLKNLLLTGSREPGGSTPSESLDEDKVDAMTTTALAPQGFGETAAPTNWVPSQQDDRPRH